MVRKALTVATISPSGFTATWLGSRLERGCGLGAISDGQAQTDNSETMLGRDVAGFGTNALPRPNPACAAGQLTTRRPLKAESSGWIATIPPAALEPSGEFHWDWDYATRILEYEHTSRAQL